ncbi:MAG: glycosyltransferase family 4 protein [Verrucomicrobiae bacterium]|nr:glycosyltransferase family 4 protein [Verrucomicrobiae bacterium]
MSRWLYVTAAHHTHAQNIARSLWEHDALDRWWSGLVVAGDAPAARLTPWKQRVLKGLPSSRLRAFRRWEFLRVIAHRAGVGPSFQDRLWERGERALDARAAHDLRKEHAGVIGFEHGCLATLLRARKLGLRRAVVFASAHHSFRARTVDPEYARWSAWCDPDEGVLLKRAAARDRRRDDEIAVADTVVANSLFTARTILEGAAPAARVVTAPLGFPEAAATAAGGSEGHGPLRLIYVGAVAMHKGFPRLQEAFAALPRHAVRLDVFGAVRVRAEALATLPNLAFHGPVSRERLLRAFAEADALVFPTLCDGFGMAAAEAMAHGVPVLCSRNAGVSAFVQDGVNGFLFDPLEEGALQARLHQSLDERARLAEMRPAALRTATERPWRLFRATWFESVCRGA